MQIRLLTFSNVRETVAYGGEQPVGEGSAFMFQPGFNPVGFVLQDILAVNGIFGLKVESSLAVKVEWHAAKTFGYEL